MSEASKILAPLGPHLDPAAVLTAMAEEQLKAGLLVLLYWYV